MRQTVQEICKVEVCSTRQREEVEVSEKNDLQCDVQPEHLSPLQSSGIAGVFLKYVYTVPSLTILLRSLEL